MEILLISTEFNAFHYNLAFLLNNMQLCEKQISSDQASIRYWLLLIRHSNQIIVWAQGRILH